MSTTTRREFIRNTGTAALALGLLPYMAKGNSKSTNSDLSPDPSFLRKTPESQGVSSSAISRFLEAANSSGLQWHSFMLLRHGNVIAEGWWNPFAAPYKHTLYSLSKSFTSTAIGILVKDGRLKVEDTVISFFPDDIPTEVSENLKSMTVKHLLSMNTGHAEDTTPKMREGSGTWTKTFLSLPVQHEPGTHFLYNTGATYMLGAIVRKVTGEDLEAFLTPRLFEPLGIKDHDWEKSPDGLSVAGWGLRLKTEDIAKLGQLYLQKGKWNGKDILTESWVMEATGAQTASNPGDGDWSQGYGYQFWRCKPGFFRADGAFGQYCIVMPQYDAVLVVNSESWDMQKQMAIMWETLLPAMQPAALQDDNGALDKLKSDISNLSIPVTKGSINEALVKKYNGAKFTFDKNEFDVDSVELKFPKDQAILTVNSPSRKLVLHAGWEKWNVNKESLPYVFAVSNRNPVPSKIAASSTWVSQNTLQFDLKFIEGIHTDKVSLAFEGDKLSIALLNSVSENTKTSPEKRSKLEGRLS